MKMLFLVRTQPIKEDKVIEEIVNKVTYFNLPIYSVSNTGVKGFIYVETDGEPNIRDLLYGIQYCRGYVHGDTGAGELIEERIVSISETFPKDTIVRFSKGIFKGDRGRVVGSDEKKGELTLINLDSKFMLTIKAPVDDIVK